MAEMHDVSWMHEAMRERRRSLDIPLLPTNLLAGKASADKIEEIRQADAACDEAIMTNNFAKARGALEGAADVLNSARLNVGDLAVQEFSSTLAAAVQKLREIEKRESGGK